MVTCSLFFLGGYGEQKADEEVFAEKVIPYSKGILDTLDVSKLCQIFYVKWKATRLQRRDIKGD